MINGIYIKETIFFIYNSKHYSYSFLITIIYCLLCIKISCENHRILINLNSEIHFVINGIGNQSILNNTFYIEPFKVYVNSINRDSCKTSCIMDYEINHITLIFNDNIESSENMFYGCENMTEIDLSKFDFSKIVNTS